MNDDFLLHQHKLTPSWKVQHLLSFKNYGNRKRIKLINIVLPKVKYKHCWNSFLYLKFTKRFLPYILCLVFVQGGKVIHFMCFLNFLVKFCLEKNKKGIKIEINVALT